MTRITGTIEQITTMRDGMEWSKREVYVPVADYSEFVAQWHHVFTGNFAYSTRTVKTCGKAPSKIAHWKD